MYGVASHVNLPNNFWPLPWNKKKKVKSKKMTEEDFARFDTPPNIIKELTVDDLLRMGSK